MAEHILKINNELTITWNGDLNDKDNELKSIIRTMQLHAKNNDRHIEFDLDFIRQYHELLDLQWYTITDQSNLTKEFINEYHAKLNLSRLLIDGKITGEEYDKFITMEKIAGIKRDNFGNAEDEWDDL